MPKVSSRFRNRKINFKTHIPIYIGSLDIPFDDDYALAASIAAGHGPASPGASNAAPAANGLGGPPPGFGINEAGETVRVETGVDKEEEHEHHLQAVISASAAALSRSTRPGANGAASGPSKPSVAHIPTPDATGLVADYKQYYKHGIYTDPHSYIRSSDTVEETMGIAYTMDEEDEDFIEEYNSSQKENRQSSQLNGSAPAPPHDAAKASPVTAAAEASTGGVPHAENFVAANQGRYPPLSPLGAARGNRKEKAKEVSSPPPCISEDDFELVMDLFERITDRRNPTLHLDVSRIPSLDDLQSSFSTYLPSQCIRSACVIAQAVYPHWKDRRLRAGGKSIIPQLDVSVTPSKAEREVKVARKTRRTDTQTMERLIRLKSDLSSAQELLTKVLDRERCKREFVYTESKVFENRYKMRSLKRKLGESVGDEALLITKREKRRRRDELSGTVPGGNKILLNGRAGLGGSGPGMLPDPLPPYKDRTINATQRVEKDMQRKREQEMGWEDLTDTAYAPLPLAHPGRFWRALERLFVLGADGRRSSELWTFDQQTSNLVSPPVVRFRKRTGRGGRLVMDRLLPRKVEQLDGEDANAQQSRSRAMQERWRFDMDLASEYASAQEPTIIDDFETKYMVPRVRLIQGSDREALCPTNQHIEEASAWATREPDPLPPIQVIGKLPGNRITVPQSNGAVAGGQVNVQMANQILAAANRAQNLAQAQAHALNAQQQQLQQQARRVSAAPQPPTAGASPATNGTASTPQQPQIRRLVWESQAVA